MAKYPLKQRNKKVKPYRLFAWDLETTLIKKNDTPRLKYITAYGVDKGDREWKISQPINYFEDLGQIVVNEFLKPTRAGCKYVAWNSNRFDSYFLAISLVHWKSIIKSLEGDIAFNPYLIIPYFTKSKQIRGLRVQFYNDPTMSWEFVDGIAMTGIDKPLKKFVKAFAPNYAKLDIGLKSGNEFDPTIKEHVEYAEMDSIALYHAMMNCNNLVNNLTDGLFLTSTIGNLGIKYFQKMLPKYRRPIRVDPGTDPYKDKKELCIWPPHQCLMDVIPRLYRGGFVHTAKEYWRGEVWKYDLNQAYAAAMRDCDLPAGDLSKTRRYKPMLVGMYCVTAQAPLNTVVPFYYKDEHLIGQKTTKGFERQWITSAEYEQLFREGWTLKVYEGFFWPNKFNMKAMVDRLETIRLSDPKGPNGPLGTLCKSLGNNSYGKTAEKLWGKSFLFSNFKPKGYEEFIPDWENPEDRCPYIFVKEEEDEQRARDYHQPQIAATITAHVRMVVRRAALLGGDAWVFSDTDSCVYSRDMSKKLKPLSDTAYGAWKLESAGVEYTVVEDKTYYSRVDNIIHAKGLNINPLTYDAMDQWYNTRIKPEQRQVQRANFFKFMQGITPMFKDHTVNQTEETKLRKRSNKKTGKNVTYF